MGLVLWKSLGALVTLVDTMLSKADSLNIYTRLVNASWCEMTISDKLNLVIAVAAGLSAIVAAFYTAVTAKILRVNRDAVAAMQIVMVIDIRPTP